MNLDAFFARKKVGLILRMFCTKPEQIPDRVKMMKGFIDQALGLKVVGHDLISRIDVLVWADQRYNGQSDCGQTAQVMREEYPRINKGSVFVSKVKHGDLFCGILNYGVALQSRAGIDYSIIASSEAQTYFTPETMTSMIDAANQGALAIGVAINELTESILAGRLANTLAMWHNVSLLSVGGFDLRAAKPINEKTASYMRGWHTDKGDVYYHLAGVEEVIPLARLVEIYGQCIAPIKPSGDGVQLYLAPESVTESELWERHVLKMGTKLERQSALLAAIGFDPSFLSGGVLSQYR